ncbi:MAG: glycosyltransferase family 4 protein [Candidatus Omnitrophota bacterium]|jgi:glycosyltransferase involved in cell wall biosynthesis
MKILYATFDPGKFGLGGAEKVLLDVLQAMRERFGHEVACVSNRGKLTAALEKRGVTAFCVPQSKLCAGAAVWGLDRILRSFRPDLVHSHHRYMTFLFDLFFKHRSVILHTEHVLRTDKRGLFRYGHCATAVGGGVRQNLVRHFGVPEDRCVLIPNAVPEPKPDPAALEEIRQKYARRSGEVFAFCPARFEEQKAHEDLVLAAARLSPAQREKIRIFLAGDGTLQSFIRREVERLGLGDTFVFLGYSTRIPEWFAACDFMVLPSLWEGLPLTVLEAYQAGKPVLATDIPGTRDLVESGRTGELIKAGDPAALADAMGRWVDDPARIVRYGASAKAYVRQYSFDRMAGDYDRLYLEWVHRINGQRT